MKKNKFRCLILILALCMAKNPLDAFANTGNSNTILEGEIGLWDPHESDKPNFSGIADTDIEGKKPTEGEYFNVISVTVPIDMEFMVLPSSTSTFGSFYAPKYTIKNNSTDLKAVIDGLATELNNLVTVGSPATQKTSPATQSLIKKWKTEKLDMLFK